jgi:Tfp pilus assembly protein PilO
MIEKISWFKNQSIYRYVRQQAEKNKFFKYLEISATFLLITIFLITAIAPTASAISKLLGEIKSKEITTKLMTQKLDNIALATTNYSQAQEQQQFQLLESSYPSKPEFYQVASNFSSISRQTGVSINQLKYAISNKTNKSDDYFYGVNLLINGSYSAFLDTINRFAQSRRLTNINSITFKQSEKGFNLSISTDLNYLPANYNNEK